MESENRDMVLPRLGDELDRLANAVDELEHTLSLLVPAETGQPAPVAETPSGMYDRTSSAVGETVKERLVGLQMQTGRLEAVQRAVHELVRLVYE